MKYILYALTAFLLISASADAALSQQDFDRQITQIRQQVGVSDFRGASTKAISLRNLMVDRKAVPRNFPEIFDRLGKDSPTVTGVLATIQDAQDKYLAEDLAGAAHALDVTCLQLAGLLRQQSPETQFAAIKKQVDSISGTSGLDAPHPLLHEAARLAFETGRYAESLQYSERELRSIHQIPGSAPTGWANHLAHTTRGLTYLALGDAAHAAYELAASAPTRADRFFRQGPSMALAAALLSRNRQAVTEYLDKCSRIQYWSSAAQAIEWKQSIQAGNMPDFGVHATGVAFR